MSLAIVTPSYIDSATRARFATESLRMLRACVPTRYPHVVVDDLPRGRGVLRRIASVRWREAGARIYRDGGILLTRRRSGGSRSATLEAVREARRRGAELVFIHLDDQVYVPRMDELLRHTVDAFARDPELSVVRLGGDPILSQRCSPERGNLSQLRVSEEEVRFRNVVLTPLRTPDYTLWRSAFHPTMTAGDFWPLALWCAVYRASLLESLLADPAVEPIASLGAVEVHYQSNWSEIVPRLPGGIGYINMQFGGFEMHRNQEWEEMLRWPNEAVR